MKILGIHSITEFIAALGTAGKGDIAYGSVP
jgi:hypothetical protein